MDLQVEVFEVSIVIKRWKLVETLPLYYIKVKRGGKGLWSGRFSPSVLDFRDEHQGRQKHHCAGNHADISGTDQAHYPVANYRAQGAANTCQADMHRHISTGFSGRGIFNDPQVPGDATSCKGNPY